MAAARSAVLPLATAVLPRPVTETREGGGYSEGPSTYYWERVIY